MVNWAQVLFNSGITGSVYLISAIGLTLTYGLSGFPNFAHAEFMTLGAYMGYFVSDQLGFGFPFAFIAAFIASGLLGALCYRGIFKLLAGKGASLVHLMVAAIGLSFALRHSIGEIWGWGIRSFTVTWTFWDFGTVRMSDLWLGLIFTTLVIAGAMHLLLIKTKAGKAVRAISSNPELALASGINITQVTLMTWLSGAGLAGIAGVFWSAGTRLSPMLGWDLLLPAFAVTILGGIGSFYGAIVAAFIMGLAENIGVVILTNLGISTEYRMAVAFLVLIITLILRPQGLARMFRST